MKMIINFLAVIALFSSCSNKGSKNDNSIITVAHGQMPALAASNEGSLHMVFGSGDSLMYSTSINSAGSYSLPFLIDTIPNLVDYATRGPQIAVTKNGLAVIAVNKEGDIFSYIKDAAGNWIKTGKVNDVDTVDKEGFLGLGSEGDNLFAIWTDLRNDEHNKLYGAKSIDGGKSWQKNLLIYASPDSTICECCKPSVVMNGKNVFVMFRNWLNGNRDMYVIGSSDGGQTFGKALKLGKGSWPLNGCPMDGGSLAVNKQGNIETVWRRESVIYTSEPGKPEIQIGEGKSCTIETVNGQNVYAWMNNGNITCLLPGDSAKIIGQGSLPLLQTLKNNKIVCVWQNNQQIQSYVLQL